MTARARSRKKQLDDRIQSLKDQIDYQYELGNNRLAEILKDELQFEINNNNNRLKINNINIKEQREEQEEKNLYFVDSRSSCRRGIFGDCATAVVVLVQQGVSKEKECLQSIDNN
jgi:hypothetical protein